MRLIINIGGIEKIKISPKFKKSGKNVGKVISI